jgi:hypothetical protein
MIEIHHIPGLFETIAGKVNNTFSTRVQDPFTVYFDYGHYDAVNKNLINKDGSITQKDKYPLIWLITPFGQNPPSLKQDFDCELTGLDFLFVIGTNEEDSISERVDKYFKPRLWPIVQEFKNQIDSSGFFQVLCPDAIPYDYMKDWYYQAGYSGKNNLFNDHIDAVQIKNMRLRVNESVPNELHFF